MLEAVSDGTIDAWPPQLVRDTNDPSDTLVWERALAPLQANILHVSGRGLDCLPSCLFIYQKFEKPTPKTTKETRQQILDCIVAQHSLHGFTMEATNDLAEALADEKGVVLADQDFGSVELLRFALSTFKAGFLPSWLLQTFATITNITVWLLQTQDSTPMRYPPQHIAGRDAPSRHMVVLYTCPKETPCAGEVREGHYSLVVSSGNHEDWLQQTMPRATKQLLKDAAVPSLTTGARRACRGRTVGLHHCNLPPSHSAHMSSYPSHFVGS